MQSSTCAGMGSICSCCFQPSMLSVGLPRDSVVKNPPATAGAEGSVLGWKDPLEKEMAAHSSILAHGKSHGQRSLVGYSPCGRQRVGHNLVTKTAIPSVVPFLVSDASRWNAFFLLLLPLSCSELTRASSASTGLELFICHDQAKCNLEKKEQKAHSGSGPIPVQQFGWPAVQLF